MEATLKQYIDSRKNAWMPSTIKTTTSALKAVLNVLDGNPERLLSFLNEIKLKPYTQKVRWNQVSDFWQFVVGQGENRYRQFLELNRNLFKNAYLSEKLSMTYEQAEKAILADSDEEFKTWALHLLRNGLRYSEALTECQSQVLGKGKKTREILFKFEGEAKWSKSHKAFWIKLRKIGLKPHSLRKLSATRMLEKGVSIPDLCGIMGWSSLNTAIRYLQPKKMDELREFLK